MSFLIKKTDKPLFIRTEIDSAGMSVGWMDIIYADQFSTRKDAEDFIVRCKERYLNESFEIVEHEY